MCVCVCSLRNTILDALRNRPGWVETDSDSEWDFVSVAPAPEMSLTKPYIINPKP